MTTLLSFLVFTILFLVFGFRAAQHLKEAYLHNYDVASARAEASGRELSISPEYPATYSAVVILAITFGGLALMALGEFVPILGVILSVLIVVIGFWLIISTKISKHQIKAIQNALYTACFTFIFSLTSIIYKYDHTGGLRTIIVFFVSIVASFLMIKLLGFTIVKTRSKKRSSSRKLINRPKPHSPKPSTSHSSNRKTSVSSTDESKNSSEDSAGNTTESEILAVIITLLFIIGLCVAWIIVLV